VATIAVIGSGAVGSYYGAMLARAGDDVRFLMRRDLEAVRQRGLDIRSHRGDFRLDDVQAFASPSEIGPVDWVLCALKTTALGQARELVAPCTGPQTKLLALMNGLGVEEQFVSWMPPGSVFGGMAFVCLNRGEPGIVHHLDYGRVTIGHFEDDTAPLEGLRALLAEADIEVAVAPNLRRARWEKLCWNIPFNGLSAAAGGIGTGEILDHPGLRAMAERAMREVITVANADLASLGHNDLLDAEAVVAAMFGQTETMGDYQTSMTIDYRLGRPLEVDAILGEPWRRAKELGIDVPTISALYALVDAADAGTKERKNAERRNDGTQAGG
jgi:2-dehydropantoate 2-reductase